jgi:ABC-type phosphate transport system substrate-binding protein
MNILVKTTLLAGLAFAAATAQAEVVVIVSAKSTATTMKADEIANIYLGKSNAMKPVVKAIWSKLVFTGKAMPPKELPSSAEVVKAVAADPNAIGYIDATAIDGSVKVVYEVK